MPTFFIILELSLVNHFLITSFDDPVTMSDIIAEFSNVNFSIFIIHSLFGTVPATFEVLTYINIAINISFGSFTVFD